MTAYWWVNHNQTVRQEISGQYLWSPKTESNGARSEFYNNMRRATPGDLILSYAGQAISYVGRVAEFAFTAPKPSEFGSTGSYWNDEGWLLPVFWTPLEPQVHPKMLVDRLGPLLPTRYSPFNPTTGSGNQKAYLAAIDESAFEIIVNETSFDRSSLARGGANSLTYKVVTELLEDAIERQILDDLVLEDTVKESVVRSRRGQGIFRSNVSAIDPSCRLTGITNPVLLIASHIKPWRVCDTSQERLTGMNGLMLTPDADLLFDRGFISFKDDGEVLVSPRVESTDLQRLGFSQLTWDKLGFNEAAGSWRTSGFLPQQSSYLAFHRSSVFIDLQ